MRFRSVLSEILAENVLITEAKDKREVIVDTFGYSPEWANEFYEISPKMCVWIADSFLKEMMKRWENIYPHDLRKKTIQALNTKTTPKTTIWNGEAGVGYKEKYQFIFDWFINVNAGGNINLKSMTFQEALDASEEWHESRSGVGTVANYEEKHEIVLDYRNENGVGFYWANLGVSYSKEEADRMNHCGNKSGTVLFSLRKIHENHSGESYVTLARNNDGTVSEMHGKKNSKPKAVYHKYIIDFLLNKKYPVTKLTLKGVYKPDHNFNIDDLTEEQKRYVFDNNIDIKLNYVLGEDAEVISKNIDDEKIAIVFRRESRKFGIVNLDTIEIVKPFNYVRDSSSKYQEVFHFKPGHIFISNFYKSKEDNDHFITLRSMDFNHYINSLNNNWDKLEGVPFKFVEPSVIEDLIKQEEEHTNKKGH